MVLAAGAVDVGRLLWRGGQLSWQDNPPAFLLLGQMFGDFRMEGLHIADQAMQEPPGLEVLTGKLRDDGQGAVQHVWSGAGIGDLLGLLLGEGVVFLLEPLGKDRHGRRGDVQRAQGTSQRLDSRDDFGILSVTPVMEIPEGDHFDQVEERGGFLAAGNRELTIEFAPDRGELFAETFLLVFAAAVQIGAIRRTGDSGQTVFAATGATNQPAERRARTFPLMLMTIEALAHLRGGPSLSAFSGSTNP